MAKVAPEIPGVVPLEETDETPSPVEYIPRRSRVTQSPPSKVYQTITNEMEAEIREMEENDSRNEIAYTIIKAFIFLMIIAIFAAGAVLIKLKMEKNETQTKPTTANPINPTTVGPNDPSITEPTDPTTTDPSDPTTAQPTDSTTAGPTNPTTVGPTDPTTAEPTEPTTVGPTDQSPKPSPSPTTVDPTDTTTAVPAKSCEEGYVFHYTYNGTAYTYQGDFFDQYLGDGYCSDITNIAECHYDGGDCCGDDVRTDYCDDSGCYLTCDECICHQINTTTTQPTNPTTADPTDPTTAGPTNPTTVGPTDPTTAEPTDPTTVGPTNQSPSPSPTTVDPTDATVQTTADPAKSCDEDHVFYYYYEGYDYTFPGDYFDGWVGDGYCHDIINIAECNYDGGDCCGDDVKTEYCDDSECDETCNECICHEINATTAQPTDPTTAEPTDPTTPEPTNPTTAAPTEPTTAEPTDPTTAQPTDPTTAESTNPITVGPTDPTTTQPTDPTTTQPTDQTTAGPTGLTTGPTGPTTVPTDPCVIYQSWIGDLYCDDITNTAECGYDGGDCCGDEVDTDYCEECICYQ